MNILPEARMSDIVVQHLKGETLVYDLITDKAFCLNETAKIIFDACGNQLSFAELKRRHKFSDEIIFFTLEELKKINLLAKNDEFASPFAGMTRREVIRRVGLSSAVALPLISSLVAPKSTDAASGAVACASVGSQCFCQNGDTNSCGQGRVIFAGATTCPANCTCFTPGTCSTAGAGCFGSCR